MFAISQQICRIRLPARSRANTDPASGGASSVVAPALAPSPHHQTSPLHTSPQTPNPPPRRCPPPPAALRAPRHAYGGPEPFGTGAGVLRWEREAGSLLLDHLRAERERDWKRLRHRLILNGPGPREAAELGPERTEEIARMRLQVRYKKFWDLMNERDRPWHFDTIVHLCTALSAYSCERYMSVTAGTMQGILAQRAKAERAVRDLREDCRTLQRRLASMAIRMSRTGRPASPEQLSQAGRLEAQVSAGCGIAEWQLQRLVDIARATYQDHDYVDQAEALLPLLQEAKLLSDVARREMLPAVQALRDELEDFQYDLAERRLPRDQVLRFYEELRSHRDLPPADRDRWPPLTPDEAVDWRYPPLEYWRSAAGARRGGGGGGDARDGRDGGGGGWLGGSGGDGGGVGVGGGVAGPAAGWEDGVVAVDVGDLGIGLGGGGGFGGGPDGGGRASGLRRGGEDAWMDERAA